MINTTAVYAAAYNKTLNVSTGAVGLTNAAIGFTSAQVLAASRVVIGVEGQAVRIARGGTATSANGIKWAVASVATYDGANDIRNLSIIALVDGAVLQIELEA